MADTSLRDRLREHADAFDGLLSLIPAKLYYGEDTTDQWKRTKQTKAQARAAKRGKLDPDSELNRNAKEVMDERARNKRKLQDMQDDEDDVGAQRSEEDDGERFGDLQMERPGEGLEKGKGVDRRPDGAENPELNTERSARKQAKEEKRQLKREKQRDRKRLKSDNQSDEMRKPTSDDLTNGLNGVPGDVADAASREALPPSTATPAGLEVSDNDLDISHSKPNRRRSISASSDSGVDSPMFDGLAAAEDGAAELASTTTSISSTATPGERPKHIKIPTDSSALRQRLAAKIEALRAARKANGDDGKPIRTRQELIEARREKQAERKVHKKEMRRLAKAEEERKREEALASARNSPGGALSPAVGGDLDDESGAGNYFAFGRVAFGDGAAMSHDLSYVKPEGKKNKGPSDPKSALALLAAQKKRVAGLDEDKRKEVLEKETWLAARRRAEGTKVQDDEGLLKKAVKRKEKAKKKSETEWKDRTKGVEQAMKDRQRKREANISKRKEQKMMGKAGKKKAGKPAKKNRAGFEGEELELEIEMQDSGRDQSFTIFGPFG